MSSDRSDSPTVEELTRKPTMEELIAWVGLEARDEQRNADAMKPFTVNNSEAGIKAATRIHMRYQVRASMFAALEDELARLARRN